MATLTALSLLAGSAALVLGVNAAKGIENAPPPEEPALINSHEVEPVVEPPAKALAKPVVEPVAEPEAKPAAEPVAEPVAEAAAEPMAGGAIGRPKWGIISSNVMAPQDTTLGVTVSNALGIREDPRALSDQIILVERQLETVNFNGFVIDKKIAEVVGKYKKAREDYAVKFAESKNQELTAADYLKKLNSQGQQNQEGKKALNKIISDNSKSQAERDDAKKKLAEMGQPKEVDDVTLAKWRKSYTDATAKKIEADDDKTDAERDKNKYFAELSELRTKKEEQEKLAKELIAKRTALLTRYQAVLLQKKKKEPQPVDMQARNDRYAKAIAAKNVAEENLRRFYSNTWLPLEGQPSQATYQGQFSSLQTIWRNAKAEVELAQAALTAPSQVSTTDAEAEFAAFASDVGDLTRNAIDRNGEIKPDFAWGPDVPGQEGLARDDPARKRGYPSAVKTLKEYTAKPKLRIAANVYYEIANMDTPTLIRNIPRFLDYFKKLKGTIGIRSERERPSSFSAQGDVTNLVLKKFVARVVELAANQVRLYPRPADIDPRDPQAVLYAQLRDKTNEFVDKQVFLVTKMFKVIKAARKTTKLSGVEGKNLLELEEKAKELYPIADGVPPKGTCELIFKPATFEALSTGMFKGKNIIQDVLENPTLKDDFLDAIGFIKVSNLIEAQEYARTRGATQATAIKLIKEAAFEEYTKNAERLAFENPTGQSYVRIGGDWAYLNAMNGIGPLSTNPLNITLPVPGGGNLIPNPRRAQQLRDEANLHQFVPGVFLEAGRLQPDGTRVKSIEPLVNFRDACETDGNVGQGSEQTSRILDILDRIASMEISPKEEANPLLTMIKKLEEKKKIDITRPDQAEPQSSLAQHGFPNGVDNWAVMRVTDEPKLNFVQTFLTFRSSKFRSIPYNDTTVYGGKTVNTRELYAKLALAEIEKMPSFESRTKDDKESFPDDADWQRLSDDFHLNFVIYRDNKGRGIADRSAAGRPNAPLYNVFKAKNGRYYPVRMNAGPVVAPGLPGGVNGPQFAQFNRGILGGAIDGLEFPVATFEPEEKTGEFLERTVGAPVRKGLSTAASKIGKAASNVGTATKTGLSAAASGIGTAASAAASGIGTAASATKTGLSAAASGIGTAASAAASNVSTKVGESIASFKAARAAAKAANATAEEKRLFDERCAGIIRTVMDALPESERNKKFSELDERWRTLVRSGLEANGFNPDEIETCMRSDLIPTATIAKRKQQNKTGALLREALDVSEKANTPGEKIKELAKLKETRKATGTVLQEALAASQLKPDIGINPFAAIPSPKPAAQPVAEAVPAPQFVADRELNPFAAAVPRTQEDVKRVKRSNVTGSTLAEALTTSKARTKVDSSIRCREVIQAIMAELPASEQGKSFSQLDERYKENVRQMLEREGFSAADIKTCLATDVFPKPAAPIPRPVRAALSPRAAAVPVKDRVYERLGQLQDTKRPDPADVLPPLLPGQSAQEANAASIRGMFPEGDTTDVNRRNIQSMLEPPLSRQAEAALGVEDDEEAPRPVPRPAPTRVASATGFVPATRRGRYALGADSDDEGGRRRTRTNWRRSKPARYTRRKF